MHAILGGTITAAMVFYSLAVWCEARKKCLRWSHMWLFGLGLLCDVLGTTAMAIVSTNTDFLHSVVGFSALVLMLAHCVWAAYVLVCNHQKLLTVFHRYSQGVWCVWMAAFLTGLVRHIWCRGFPRLFLL